jgi:two-component system nitrogen regulation response regulator GlnG
MEPQIPIRVLVVDDEESIRWVIRKAFDRQPHYDLTFAVSAEEATEVMDREPMDFALVDIRLPGDDGLTFVERQRVKHPGVLMAVITGEGSMSNTVTAMKLGAFDFLAKPFGIDEIESLFKRAAQAIRLGRRKDATGAAPLADGGEDLIVGRSRSIREIYKAIGRVAETDLTVLILGESGTGKELIAQAIHQHSGSAGGPFVAMNCAAIPRDLLEAELFGYEKGAFTGATERKPGRMEHAKGGTLFLDEIGDMSLDLQAKLLRVLQEREFQRVGGLETVRLNARVLAATNQSLLDAVEAGRFRRDLYYRIAAFTIQADPLRERREDIPSLADYFLRRYTAKLGLPPRPLTPEAREALARYDWPGNVRELENVIKSLVIMTRSAMIDVPDLPRAILGGEAEGDSGERFEQAFLRHWAPAIQEAVETGKTGLLDQMTAHVERPLIRQVLMLTRWNQVRTSQVLGINRNTLRTKLQALGIQKPGSGESA